MQGIGTHIPETNYVPREHGVAAILLFLFMVLISLLAVLLLLLLLLLCFILFSLSFKCVDRRHYQLLRLRPWVCSRPIEGIIKAGEKIKKQG